VALRPATWRLAPQVPRRVPLNQWADAYARKPDDIKTV
jgi:hypothetical protein